MSTNTIPVASTDGIDAAKAQYAEDMEKMSTMSSEQAYMFIITNLLPDLEGAEEAYMSYGAQEEDIAGQVQNIANNMQADYNDYLNQSQILANSSYSDQAASDQMTADLNDAINQATLMQNYMAQNPEIFGDMNDPSSMAYSINQQLDAIFGGSGFSTYNSTTNTYTAVLFNPNDPSTFGPENTWWNSSYWVSGSSENSPETNATTYSQPITDGFNSIDSSLTNVMQTLQSWLSWVVQQDNTCQGLQKTAGQSVAEFENTSTKNELSN